MSLPGRDMERYNTREMVCLYFGIDAFEKQGFVAHCLSAAGTTVLLLYKQTLEKLSLGLFI